MDQEETSMSEPQSPKAEPMAAPNEAELSRIAREAVHQPADPRLDRQLARMGVVETAAPTDAGAGKPGQAAIQSVVSSGEVERLGGRVRRLEMIAGVLAVAVVVLAVISVMLLVR
jgi:hypothetical protein